MSRSSELYSDPEENLFSFFFFFFSFFFVSIHFLTDLRASSRLVGMCRFHQQKFGAQFVVLLYVETQFTIHTKIEPVTLNPFSQLTLYGFYSAGTSAGVKF